jgi:hypothetical protein
MKNDENGFCGMSGLGEVEQKCMIASWIDTELSTMLFMPVIINVADTYKSSSFLEPRWMREENWNEKL